MTKSALQIARAAYQPKVPAALKGAVKAVDGEYTQSVADQDEIKNCSRTLTECRSLLSRKSNEEEGYACHERWCDPFRWSGSRWVIT